MVFTWPYPSVVRIGSIASTTATPTSPSTQPRGTPQRFITDCCAQISRNVQISCQSQYGPTASGTINTAAIGG